MANAQHSQNDAVKVAARSAHSAARILQWPPSHPSKSRSPYSALEPVWWNLPSHISKLKFTLLPHWSCSCNAGFPFFPHHAKCTWDEDGDVCTDHWGFICLYPGYLWTSFTPLCGQVSSAKYYYIHMQLTLTPSPSITITEFIFLPFSFSINDKTNCTRQVIYHWVSSSIIFCIFFLESFFPWWNVCSRCLDYKLLAYVYLFNMHIPEPISTTLILPNQVPDNQCQPMSHSLKYQSC